MSIPITFPYPRSANVELFDYYASLTIANGTSTSIFSQQLPTLFKRGFITYAGFGIDNPTAFNGSIWQIRVNSVADRYYQSIQDQLGSFDDPKEIAPILVRPGDLISVYVTNTTGASHLYAGRLRGFFDFAYGEKS